MKKLLLTSTFLMAFVAFTFAQLPNGSTAPDFTENDINGVSQNLYTYLDGGQVVFIDFMATWCGPCWNYHQTHAIRDVYNNHPEVMAFMIEGDAATNVNCLYGPTGCNNTTLGDWVTGTPYPTIDAASLTGPYAIAYYPTIYGVCPDKKIYEVGQVGESQLWNFAIGCSAPSMEVLAQADVNCFGESTGSISLLTNGGMPPFTWQWNNGATTQDLTNIPVGNYTVTVTGSLGGTKTFGPVTVSGPAAPLESSAVNIVDEGCGFGGNIDLTTSGGTAGYSYLWNNGATSSSIYNLPAGSYSVTTTDILGCTHELLSIVVNPPSMPTAAAAAPAQITCATTSMYLDGSGSSIGPDISYLWITGDGNIVSGSNTLFECLVNAPGTYELYVTNVVSNCFDIASTVVIADVTLPSAVANAPGNLNCTSNTTALSGVGSATGAGIEYLWTTSNGNIVSGATTLTPTVNEAGTYTLLVTNNDNGCTSEASTVQQSNTAPPNASASGGELTCSSSTVTLQGNSTTNGVTYGWTGPGGYNSNQQNPEVGTSGTYTLTVTNPANGCTETATASVTGNSTPPNAEADGGTITCAAASVTLSGNSSTSGATYSWTGPNNYTSNDQNPSVNETGTYTLTVTGPNGCTGTDNATVNQNTNIPTANAGANGALNCNSSSIVLNGTGSSNGSQFTYLWTTTNGNIVSGANTLTPTVDTAGDYNLVVTNINNSCESTDTASVTQIPVVEADISSQTNINCFGGSNGSATVDVSGGSGSFTYAWSNGDTTATVNNLSAGSYSVVVTDGDNCTASENVTISQPAALVVVATATAQSSPGVNDGTATATPTGGTGAYTYSWNTGATTATITDLSPGTYTVMVTDENGCTKSQTVTVNSFGCAMSAAISGTGVTCHGLEDGTASIELSNALEPFTFSWSNGETTQTISDLAPGTYTVTASDDNGCETVASIEVEEPGILNPNTTSTSVTASGASDGTATANPTGGTGPFTYLWSNGETTATITNLPSANYTVVVTDTNGCSVEKTVPVAPFACSMAANITSSNISCFGNNDGQATVTLANGLSPFTYEWSNGETTATVSNLAPGTYTVEVSDAVNCPAFTEVIIAEPTLLEAAITAQANADCGQANGSATAEGTGGTGSLTYEWSNGETTTSVTGLAGGTYTVSVTDANDCVATTEVQITVDDTESPNVITQDISVEIGANGTTSIQPEDVDNGSTDNCSIQEMTLDVSSFDCEALGQQEVTLTVVDEAGNSSSATAIVTVTDMTSPNIDVQNIVVELDENGEAIITPEMIDGGSTDNCGIVEMSVDLSSFTCADMGANAVVLTVKDAAGNTASGTAIVTVEDNMAPEATCPEDMVLPYCDPVGEYTVTAIDNCSSNLTYQYPANYPSGATFPTGETMMEVVVSDMNGNSSVCSFTVKVQSPMSINADLKDVACFGENNGSISLVVEGGASGYTYEWANGETTSTIDNLAPGNYEVVVTDEAGCTETQSFEVIEPAALAADVESITNETLNNMDGAIDISPIGGVGPYTFEWTDQNGVFISNNEDISDLSAGNYSVEVTDANGCIAQHTFTIQSIVSVIDHEMASKIKLFPNPTTGLVTMELEDVHAATANVHVFDVTGKIALSQEQVNITSGAYQFDMSGSATGVYIVRILIQNSVVTKRLIVSN